MIFELFSTREMVSAIYLILILGVALKKKASRIALKNLIEVSLTRTLITPVLCLLIYSGLIVYALQFTTWWDWKLVKDVVIWVLFVATPIFFKAASNKKGKEYPFKNMIIDNVTWSAILEFFIGAFTFSFFAEMLMVPTFAFFVIQQNHDRDNIKYKSVNNVIDIIVIIMGLGLIGGTVYKAIVVTTQVGFTDVLVSFCIPVILSIAFLPVIYLLAIKNLYKELFVFIRIRNKESNQILAIKKRKVFMACRMSYRRIQKFRELYISEYISKICSANDDETFLIFVENFRKGRYGKQK